MTNGTTTIDRYGNFDLQFGDRDDTRIYAGQTQSTTSSAVVITGGSTNTVAVPDYVTRLQNDLRQLGFGIAPLANGRFDRRTDWAVREFQIYAKMSNVAQEDISLPATTPYVERLTQVPIPATVRYTGDVTGVLNASTRSSLTHWINNHWRCPVIVQARNGSGYTNIFGNHQNLWLRDECANSTPRMFVCDFTNYYTLPATVDPRDININGHHYIVLGYYGAQGRGGPNMSTQHGWASSQITPERIWGGASGATMNAAQTSTYHTMYPTFVEECGGRFDVCNAWDTSTISIPLFHWTMGLVDTTPPQNTTGELVGLLSYARHEDANAFDEAVGFFGIRADQTWPFDAVLGAYGARVQYMKVDPAGTATAYHDVPQDVADYDYFRTWHWFYRFVMAGRTIDAWRTLLWNYARFRVREIRNASWGTGVANLSNGNAPTIGDVYSSELSTAMLLRWHVWRPAHVVRGRGANQRAGDRLRTAFQNTVTANPSLNWTTAPDTWTDAHAAALATGLDTYAPNVGANMVGAFQDIRNYTYGASQSLRDSHNSFVFVAP